MHNFASSSEDDMTMEGGLPKTMAQLEFATAEHNDDTIPSSNNQSHRRNISNISDLFDPPAAPMLQRQPSMNLADIASAATDVETQKALAEAARLRLEHNRTSEDNNKVTLDGLLASQNYENEATSHILKALEDQLGSSPAFESNVVLDGVTDEASKALLDSSVRSIKPDDAATQSSDPVSPRQEEHKPLIQQKTPMRHRRIMSVDDKLATLTDQMIGNGFATFEAPAIVPNSEFDLNTQLVFGAPAQANENQRARLFSQDKFQLRTVQEDSRLDNSTNGPTTALGGVVGDLEAPQPSSNDTTPSSSKSDIGPDPLRGSLPFNASYRPSLFTHHFSDMAENVKRDVSAWKFFFKPQQATLWKYIKLMVYVVLPLVGIAALLFYFVGNPTSAGSGEPSVSWILLFVVRLWVTLTLGLAVQALIIDVLCVGTRVIPKLLGPLLTLFIVQSKGWPFVVFVWSILNFAMLYGTSAFAAHWLFWQDNFSVFNESNPSGGIVNSSLYRNILIIGTTVPIAVSVKRLAVGLFLGRQAFLHFGERLAKVMDKMLLVSQVANLARRMEKEKANMQRKQAKSKTASDYHPRKSQIADYQDMLEDKDKEEEEDASAGASKENDGIKAFGLMRSEKFKLAQMLDHWEEPERRSAALKKASIVAVLRFRNALALIHNDYPFSFAFGPANRRKECVESAKNVYEHLLMDDATNVDFETIAASLAVEGKLLNLDRVKSLIRVFRPNRDGTLSMLDFVKSVDAVYKEFRLLQASIENSAQIDRAFEAMFNFIFYVIVIVIIMSQLGLDPMALFLSLSSVVLGFAFVIGSAASKYFEGILFILLRRPYNIGDMIHATHIEETTNLIGSAGWVVQNVTLFETTFTWLPTFETATVANGALANSRIINWARSPNARFVIFFYFPIECKYETLTLFRGAIEEYMKARPREWLTFNAFRVLETRTDKAYMKVEVIVQHREAWQNPGAIYDSRGNLISFCNEVQKLLGMQYKQPPLPIEFNAGHALEALQPLARNRSTSITNNSFSGSEGNSKADQETMAKVRQVAENKHKMFY